MKEEGRSIREEVLIPTPPWPHGAGDGCSETSQAKSKIATEYAICNSKPAFAYG
jgi:hypothetical protein